MRERPVLFSAPMVLALLGGRKTKTRRIVNLKQLRVRLRKNVTSDPGALHHVVAPEGVYGARLNPQGAVSIVAPDGELLGLRPGEFDFVCPYADGTTHLGDLGGGRKLWHITPTGSQRLWVRETWARTTGIDAAPLGTVVYRADIPAEHWAEERRIRQSVRSASPWKPSIFMPRWASRLTLEIAGVWMERLQEISEEDAKAEGLKALTKDGSTVKYGIPDRDGLPGTDDFGWPWERWNVDPRKAFASGWDEINGQRPGASWEANPWVWVLTLRRVEAQP